jgi:peptidyl-prolyl cis-trans isomerase SurA
MPELSHRQDYGNRTLINGIAACLLLLVSACTQSVDAVDASKNDPKTQLTPKEGKLREKQQVDETKDETGAKIIREQSSVSKKGTNISVLVNGTPITNYDIQRRASFLKLRRMGGDRKQKATEELVEERLKMQEASKLKTLASEAVVNKAYADFAKRNKMSGKQMGGVLDKAGVTQQHFKEFLKVQISWQRTVSEKFQIKSKNLSQSDALFTLRKSGEAKPETREYTLQQVIFVVPRAKREKLLRLRAAEAKAFSQLFTSCADTLGQVKNLRDVALKELGRVLEPELPQRWKEEVINTEVGKPTRPKETEKGIEFLAVCSVRNVSDDRAVQLVTQSKEFDSFNTKGNKANLEYLKELRSKSTIVYR